MSIWNMPWGWFVVESPIVDSPFIQQNDVGFAEIAPPFSEFLLTEAGAFILTENNEFIVTEGP